MGNGALYIRGLAASLHWSSQKDVSFWSRSNLEQINLREVSLTPTGGQAVLESWRCGACGLITFTAGHST
jgi:hypothetical protein